MGHATLTKSGRGTGPVEGTLRASYAIAVAVAILVGVGLALPAAATEGVGEGAATVNESSAGAEPNASSQASNATGAAATSSDDPQQTSSNRSEGGAEDRDRADAENPADQTDGLVPDEAVPDPVLPNVEAPIQDSGTPSDRAGSGSSSSSGPPILSTGAPGQVGQALASAPSWLWTVGLAIAGVLAAGTFKHRREARTSQGEDGPSEPTEEQVAFQPVAAPRGPTRDDEREPIEHPGAPGSMLLGRRALDDGRPGLAVGWFQTAARLEPGSAKAHLCLGVALRADGRPERAAAALSQACELDPTDASAHLHLARAFVEDGEPTQAVSALTPLVGTDPRVDQALVEDDALAPLRDDPRFLVLLGRLNGA